MRYHQAKKELMKLCGVGEKVAECICLFALHHMDAFPIDTHIRQVMDVHYKEDFQTADIRECVELCSSIFLLRLVLVSCGCYHSSQQRKIHGGEDAIRKHLLRLRRPQIKKKKTVITSGAIKEQK